MLSTQDGHRRRLRTKFLNNGFDGFLDYEIIELLLTIGLPRKDCKPLAKELIQKFKTVSGVLNASNSDIIKVKGLGESSIFGIKLAREIVLYSNKENLSTHEHEKFNTERVAKLLMLEIGYDKKESFKVICLNTINGIISETVSIGTLNSSVAHPREVFKVAIDNSAANIVVAHNHPSGSVEPSEEDIYTTRKIAEAGKVVGIGIIDHIIVARDKYSSLKNLGYL